jgi:broad specificity phosphatase PhoE
MDAVFLRHASRASPISVGGLDALDSGLSPHGRREAEGLGRLLSSAKSPLPVPKLLLCSPKRRAKETVLAIATALNLPMEISTELDERGNGESAAAFEERVRNVIENLPKRFADGDVVWLCSHLDWLEKALLFLPSDLSDSEAERPFACAEPRAFHFRQGLWRHSPVAIGPPDRYAGST